MHRVHDKDTINPVLIVFSPTPFSAIGFLERNDENFRFIDQEFWYRFVDDDANVYRYLLRFATVTLFIPQNPAI